MSRQKTPFTDAVGCTRGCLVTFLLVLLFSLLTGLIHLHTYLIYQTYQQGRYITTSGMVKPHFGLVKSSMPEPGHISLYYTVSFQDIVSTKDGQQIVIDGYDREFSTRDEAQQAANSYDAVTCWYDPAHPTHFVLNFYNANNLIGDYIWTSLGFFLGYGFLWVLIYDGFYLQLCLMRRGILTEGKATEHVQKTSGRGGTRTYTRIVFSPVDDPSHVYNVETKGAYMIGSLQSVCYDPVNPENAQYGTRPRGGCALMALAGVLVGIVIIGEILLGIWNRAL